VKGVGGSGREGERKEGKGRIKLEEMAGGGGREEEVRDGRGREGERK
jgi:hypothetical protein